VSELTNFTSVWLTVQVTQERFEVSTVDPSHYEALRDLVLGTFGILEHTPIQKLGINRNMHFRLPKERYVPFGHLLVPKEPWRGVLSEPVTRSLTVQGTQKRSSEAPAIFVKIEPSNHIEFGVFINVNEHYESAEEASTQKLMSILRDNWSEAQQAPSKIADHLLDQDF